LIAGYSTKDFDYEHKIFTPLLRAEYIKFEIKEYSELTWKRLHAAAMEAHEVYVIWCDHIAESIPDNPVDGFAQMLNEVPIPWPAMEGSAINFMTLAQYYLSFAYGLVTSAIGILKRKKASEEEFAKAENYISMAEQVVSQAKSIIWTEKDRFVQCVCACSTAERSLMATSCRQ
jgi:hypothetical protein